MGAIGGRWGVVLWVCVAGAGAGTRASLRELVVMPCLVRASLELAFRLLELVVDSREWSSAYICCSEFKWKRGVNFEERPREVWERYSHCDTARNWRMKKTNVNENSMIGDCEYSGF